MSLVAEYRNNKSLKTLNIKSNTYVYILEHLRTRLNELTLTEQHGLLLRHLSSNSQSTFTFTVSEAFEKPQGISENSKNKTLIFHLLLGSQAHKIQHSDRVSQHQIKFLMDNKEYKGNSYILRKTGKNYEEYQLFLHGKFSKFILISGN